MRPLKAEDASCAICMDSLFNTTNDLDEVMPITAPDCGHVFHEQCLQDWFKMQTNQYLARMREQGVRFRDESPTADDAPAECPSCRTEVFADPETGEPLLHRLYINFGDASSSTQAPSSSPATQKYRSIDAAGLGIARRARGLGTEIESLSANTYEEDMNGALRRAETLQADATALSVKTTAGLKKYIGGLTVAINKLRGELETHPLIPQLHDRIATLEEANERQVQNLTAMETTLIPRAIKMGAEEERKRCDKVIAAIEKERDLMQRDLQKEQVAKSNFRRAMKEREDVLRDEIEKAQRETKREREDNAALASQLHERTKLVKQLQSRAESRKELRAQIDALKLENERLRSHTRTTSRPRSVTPQKDADAEDDLSLGPTPPQSRPPVDESLIVDMPPLDLSFNSSPAGLDAAPNRIPGRSTTARSFTFDVEGGLLKDKKERSGGFGSRNQDFEFDSPLQIPTSLSITRRTDNSKSKYFPREGVLVAASSPTSTPPRNKRARSPEVIDLVSSSPLDRPSKRLPLGESKTKNVLDYLGVADGRGKLKKGVAHGVKVRRRA